MVTTVLIFVAILALFVFILFGALLEMFRDVRQLRDVAGILDRPLNIDIGEVKGTNPSVYGLPPLLNSASSAIVLFLSERCATCRSIAAGFERELPSGLWLVVDSGRRSNGSSPLDLETLKERDSDERVIVDVGNTIASRIGLETTPVGFRIENGVFVNATTIPSVRYLTSILPKPIRLKRAEQV